MRLSVTAGLVASGVLGVAALLVAKVWLPQVETKDAPKPAASASAAMVPVVAAKAAIPVGARVEAGSLTLIRLPAAAVPQGAYSSIDAVMAREGGAPVAMSALAAREPLLAARLSGVGAKPSVAAIIAPGKRAYAIGVDAIGGGGGHVLPGDRVDVLLTRDTAAFTPEGGKGKSVRADIVLQDVRVLAMNLNADFASTEKAEPDTATLEVSLEEAGRLAMASEAGTLSLALRRLGQGGEEQVRTVSAADL